MALINRNLQKTRVGDYSRFSGSAVSLYKIVDSSHEHYTSSLRGLLIVPGQLIGQMSSVRSGMPRNGSAVGAALLSEGFHDRPSRRSLLNWSEGLSVSLRTGEVLRTPGIPRLAVLRGTPSRLSAAARVGPSELWVHGVPSRHYGPTSPRNFRS
jgi:hypothetical protein